jgi:hypothetical protein
MNDPGDEHQEHVAPAPASGPGIPGAGDLLPRLRKELDMAKARQAAIRLEVDAAHDLIRQRWTTFWAIQEELDDLARQIARAGGGFDTDYYHRRRERGGSVIVRDGQHSIVEDRR